MLNRPQWNRAGLRRIQRRQQGIAVLRDRAGQRRGVGGMVRGEDDRSRPGATPPTPPATAASGAGSR